MGGPGANPLELVRVLELLNSLWHELVVELFKDCIYVSSLCLSSTLEIVLFHIMVLTLYGIGL